MDLLSQPDFSLAVGCDHAGYNLKSVVIDFLEKEQIKYEDFGTFSEKSVDYPDFAFNVSRAVLNGKHRAGILVCGTGLGMSIVANKFREIRAALCTNSFLAEFSRRHNDSNILCLGGRTISEEEAQNIVDVWLKTPFDAGRHASRLKKINDISE